MKRKLPLIIWIVMHDDEPTDSAYVDFSDAQKFVENRSPGGTWKESNAHGVVHRYWVGVDKPYYVIQLNLISREEWELPSEFEKVPRYNQGAIEAIDVIEDWGLDFNLGSVIKYICRRKTKDDEKSNLTKALTYLQRAVNVLEGRHEWGPAKK